MMKKIIALMVVVFCLGWASNALFTGSSTDAAVAVDSPAQEADTQLIDSYIGTVERDSPFDRIGEDSIHVYSDRIVIDLQNAEWAKFTDTNSMDPILDTGANAIEIVPKSAADIHVGDIASYDSEYGTVIHRVVSTGFDADGWYAVFKGDNNAMPDPGKVRFDQIRRVVVALIY